MQLAESQKGGWLYTEPCWEPKMEIPVMIGSS